MDLWQNRKKALIVDSIAVAIVGAFLTFWIPKSIPKKEIVMAVVVILFLIKDFIFRNASIGMKMFNICIVSQLDNGKPQIWQLLLRNIFLVFLWPVEYYFVFLKEKDGLGDRIAKTKLIFVNKN